MQRKIRKTKHLPIQIAHIETLPCQDFALSSTSFEPVTGDDTEGVYKFRKYMVKEGVENLILNQFGKGTKVYFKYDLRSADGLLVMNDGDDPKKQFQAEIGKNKTSLLLERLMKGMNVGEESWFRMEFNLMHSQYLDSEETNYLFLKVEQIRPIPGFLDPHVQDQRILDKSSGQLVVRKSPVQDKLEAIERLKEYAKQYSKLSESDMHHVVALYTKGKFVLGRVSKQEKKDPEIKLKHQMLLSQLHSNCAVLYHKLGQNTKVLAEAKQAKQIWADNPKAHYWLAEGNAQVKKYDEAMESMKICVDIKEKTEPNDQYLPVYRAKIHQWREAKKKQHLQSVKRSSGFFQRYQDLEKKEEQEQEQRRKEERKAKRLEEEKSQAKEELEDLESKLDALHLQSELEQGTTKLDFS